MGISPIPRKTRWTERDKKTNAKGMIIKEVQEKESYPWGDFCRVVQVIQKEGEPEDIIRLGYYVKDNNSPDEKYMWGSQTTFMAKKETFVKLLEKAKKERLF